MKANVPACVLFSAGGVMVCHQPHVSEQRRKLPSSGDAVHCTPCCSPAPFSLSVQSGGFWLGTSFPTLQSVVDMSLLQVSILRPLLQIDALYLWLVSVPESAATMPLRWTLVCEWVQVARVSWCCESGRWSGDTASSQHQGSSPPLPAVCVTRVHSSDTAHQSKANMCPFNRNTGGDEPCNDL